MAEQYAHLLIPRVAAFVPSPEQVQTFVASMVDRGILPAEATIALRKPSGKFREGRNPITGERIVWESKTRRVLDGPGQVAAAIAGLADYEVEVAGTGSPGSPPLLIDFDRPYHLGMVCRSSSKLRYTSDPDHSFGTQPGGPSFGDLCDEVAESGVFQNPHDGAVIRVPGIGSAHFWLEFELGKFLFPRIAGGDLDILAPAVVSDAESIFGVSFGQGCRWA